VSLLESTHSGFRLDAAWTTMFRRTNYGDSLARLSNKKCMRVHAAMLDKNETNINSWRREMMADAC
jgi:hypothetical protein